MSLSTSTTDQKTRKEVSKITSGFRINQRTRFRSNTVNRANYRAGGRDEHRSEAQILRPVFTVGGAMLTGLDCEHDLIVRQHSRHRIHAATQCLPQHLLAYHPKKQKRRKKHHSGGGRGCTVLKFCIPYRILRCTTPRVVKSFFKPDSLEKKDTLVRSKEHGYLITYLNDIFPSTQRSVPLAP